MQHHELTTAPSPDVNPRDMASQRRSESVTVALFALRLAKRLIEGLEYYPGREADILWIEDFLSPYHYSYTMANISGRRREDYLTTYPEIVSRMKTQPRYPARFMQLNPDHGAGHEATREMTDDHRIAIIDFCDAANEWGSVVPIPAREAQRMIELANQRRIADYDTEPFMRENMAADEHYHEDQRR